ncbi:MAG: DinB family protein [Ferruginibacter sp.]
MQNTIHQLQQILLKYTPLLFQISEAEFSEKPFPLKWSKKEIVGHLIDSAQNNIRRFVVAQYEEKPFIKYDQDRWVAAGNYQNYNVEDLLALWGLLNKHICVLLKNIPEEIAGRVADAGGLRTISWLAEDYNKHLLHHLHKILSLEEIPYP